MSGAIHKRGRCALCGKPEEHRIHRSGPSLLARLLHLAWPTWMWGRDGRHEHSPRDRRVDAADEAARILRRVRKGKRRAAK